AKAVPGRLSYAAAATAIRLGAGPAAADLLIARFREGTEAQKQVCAEALAWSDAPGAQRLLIDTLAGAGDASLLASACRSLKAGTQDGPAALRGVALSDVGEEAEVAAVERLSPRTEDEDALREIVRSGRRVRVRAAALVRLAQNLPAATGSAARKAEVSALIAEALRSPEPDLKQGAARAAALLGSPTLAEDAAVLLVELAGRSEDRALQMEAVRALGTVRGNKAAEDRLTALLSVSDDAVLLAEVARSLGELRCAAAVPKLAELAASGAVSCRVEAVGALGGIHSPAAMEAVELAFRQNIVDRAAAARALGASGDRKHVPTLAEALRSAPGLDVRAACAEALGMLGGESARAPLVEALRQDSALVRESAVRSLGRVDARDAGAAIAALCEDSDVRTAAAAREVTARWTKGQ
ncbi:MAG: HEAT repeat domain-containing protein, partial [Opitutaceae bacterium]